MSVMRWFLQRRFAAKLMPSLQHCFISRFFPLIVSIINGRSADIGDIYCEFIYFSSHSHESAREIAAAIRFGREIIIIRFWHIFNMRFYLFDF